MDIVRFIGEGCSHPAYTAALGSTNTAILDTVSSKPNVSVGLTLDGKPLWLRLSPLARELVDLGIAVYVADELNKRPVSWSREFKFCFPVNRVRHWQAAQAGLEDTLQFLSGDKFRFRFVKASKPPTDLKRHRQTLPEDYNTVSLFSGGIDSLVGATRLLADPTCRLLLVGHQADSVTCSRQTSLAVLLRKNYPGRVAFIQCRVSRSRREDPTHALPDKLEHTHRPRSFLFLCLAVAIAHMGKINRVVIPENGLIALNAPLQLSRVGSLSTRTAHPRYLSLLKGTLVQLGVLEGSLKNPFLYLTKTGVVQEGGSSVTPLLRKTVSCAHPDVGRWEGRLDRHHCGYCVPCLYRRAALHAVGLDRPSDYLNDAFASFHSASPTQQVDLRALVQFAKRLDGLSPARLHLTVLSHGHFRPESGAEFGPSAATDYGPWAKMLGDWASEFLGATQSLGSARALEALGV